jgi:para-nitrobenzyl esterase
MSTIATRLGKVRGLDSGNVKSFLGLRYGEPPTGPRRFLAPVMASRWRGIYDATQYPNRAMQERTTGTLGQPTAGALSEDCLFLNIVTPSSKGQLRPVLVWIHGGGFINGSANEYDGSVLADQGNAVVVTLNFRLGTFGFLDLSSHGSKYEGSASNGVRDLIQALQWVRENIEDYGGDPNNVTIFGESSGGSLVLSLLAAPSADRLYHKAIAHSATCAFMPAEDQTEKLAKHLGVESTEYLNKLRSMSAQEIVDLKLRFRVSVDGKVVTRPTYQAIMERGSAGVPLLTGTNRNEGTLYTKGKDAAQDHYPVVNHYLAAEMLCGEDPEQYLTALQGTYPDASPGKFHEMIWTDMFRRTCMQAAELSSLAGPGGWLYRFDLPANLPEDSLLGATHSSEIAFTFNTFANPGTNAYAFHDRNDAVVRNVAQQWSDTIIQFSKNGQPNSGGLPDWPVYETGKRNCLIIDDGFKIEPDPDSVHRRLWGG